MQYLNLGCGYRFHPNWTNVDFISTGEKVIAHNLTQGIPFSDCSFDMVYHSHVLEHFPKSKAEFFLQECYRVLRPEGILRIVVPDLEQLVKTYLVSLEKARAGEQDWIANYEWILLEMYDQVSRNSPGGEVVNYLSQESIPNESFIIQRCGKEAQKIIEYLQISQKNQILQENKLISLIKSLYRFIRYHSYRHEKLLKIVLGKEYQLLQLGRFRHSGEIHQWMYDSYSLKKLLEKTGFKNIIPRQPEESYFSNWREFNLDTEPDLTVYKPDSLYIEAIKPVL
ncbi:methyltransferase domain-containing protein [Calothrix sp. FACHB-156]|nr:methyltransferase domain-containing protein [Calothrix sp. FACHB-156]